MTVEQEAEQTKKTGPETELPKPSMRKTPRDDTQQDFFVCGDGIYLTSATNSAGARAAIRMSCSYNWRKMRPSGSFQDSV